GLHFPRLAFLRHTRAGAVPCLPPDPPSTNPLTPPIPSVIVSRKGSFRYEVTMHVDIAALTSKGQFTIPSRFRELLHLSAGSKMIIVTDGQHLLLKPITAPEGKSFRRVIQQLRQLETKTKEAKP
ncbi:MAG TPA: AbrB/MazE/SpoVT family DNA-binding domain-containing protein, partial [Candidatus Hydrogenedentes bacterium]|nr:AbrB/MazE/SpoVT family DNA-binding domain-containing protein [Candidatus Hydrogenedentota bacterium]